MDAGSIIAIVTFAVTSITSIIVAVYKFGGMGKEIGDMRKDVDQLTIKVEEGKKVEGRVLELEITKKSHEIKLEEIRDQGHKTNNKLQEILLKLQTLTDWMTDAKQRREDR